MSIAVSESRSTGRDDRSPGLTPLALSRIGGALYLAVIALGLFGEAGVRNRVVAWGDAAVTAANMRALESLWRMGMAGQLLLLVCGVTLATIFYVLIRPVSRDGALLAVAFVLVSLAVEAAMAVYLAAALFPLGAAGYLDAFRPEQLHVLSLLTARTYAYGFGVALVFFGCFCLVMGHLIRRSGYIPRAIGWLLQVAGACYLVNSFALILSPVVSGWLYPVILIPPFIGELSFALWLLLRGVRESVAAPRPLGHPA